MGKPKERTTKALRSRLAVLHRKRKAIERKVEAVEAEFDRLNAVKLP